MLRRWRRIGALVASLLLCLPLHLIWRALGVRSPWPRRFLAMAARSTGARVRVEGRPSGGDIFIHGQPNRWPGPTIARDWTDGCIALSNTEIKQLWDIVPDGTPITIRP